MVEYFRHSYQKIELTQKLIILSTAPSKHWQLNMRWMCASKAKSRDLSILKIRLQHSLEKRTTVKKVINTWERQMSASATVCSYHRRLPPKNSKCPKGTRLTHSNLRRKTIFQLKLSNRSLARKEQLNETLRICGYKDITQLRRRENQ